MVTSAIRLSDGRVAPPAAMFMWDELFSHRETTRKSAIALRRDDRTPVTLPWLVQNVLTSSSRERRDRFEMLRFAQGVFRSATDEQLVDVTVALGGFRRFKGVLITLDRMDVTSPHVYARAVEAARHLDEELSGRDKRHAVVAFQFALAVLERTTLTQALDASRAEALLLSLCDAVDPHTDAAPRRDPRVFTTIMRWISTALLDALPPLAAGDRWSTASTSYESRFLQALSGAPGLANRPAVTWEGLDYQVDLFASEHERITRIREQIESPGLDAAMAADDHDRIANALLSLIYAPEIGRAHV